MGSVFGTPWTFLLTLLKVGMTHWLLKYYQVCSNVDAGLTLTYFTARSHLVNPTSLEEVRYIQAVSRFYYT